MNLSQIKYARARAAKLFEARTKAIREKHTVPGVKLTRAEKLAAIQAGEFVVVPGSRNFAWYDDVAFLREQAEVVDNDSIEIEQNLLTLQYRKLEDELVLGDNEAALQLLRAFETEAA